MLSESPCVCSCEDTLQGSTNIKNKTRPSNLLPFSILFPEASFPLFPSSWLLRTRQIPPFRGVFFWRANPSDPPQSVRICFYSHTRFTDWRQFVISVGRIAPRRSRASIFLKCLTPFTLFREVDQPKCSRCGSASLGLKICSESGCVEWPSSERRTRAMFRTNVSLVALIK